MSSTPALSYLNGYLSKTASIGNALGGVLGSSAGYLASSGLADSISTNKDLQDRLTKLTGAANPEALLRTMTQGGAAVGAGALGSAIGHNLSSSNRGKKSTLGSKLKQMLISGTAIGAGTGIGASIDNRNRQKKADRREKAKAEAARQWTMAEADGRRMEEAASIQDANTEAEAWLSDRGAERRSLQEAAEVRRVAEAQRIAEAQRAERAQRIAEADEAAAQATTQMREELSQLRQAEDAERGELVKVLAERLGGMPQLREAPTPADLAKERELFAEATRLRKLAEDPVVRQITGDTGVADLLSRADNLEAQLAAARKSREQSEQASRLDVTRHNADATKQKERVEVLAAQVLENRRQVAAERAEDAATLAQVQKLLESGAVPKGSDAHKKLLQYIEQHPQREADRARREAPDAVLPSEPGIVMQPDVISRISDLLKGSQKN